MKGHSETGGEPTASGLGGEKKKIDHYVPAEGFDFGDGKMLKAGDVIKLDGDVTVTFVGLEKGSDAPVVQTTDGKYHLLDRKSFLDRASSAF